MTSSCDHEDQILGQPRAVENLTHAVTMESIASNEDDDDDDDIY